MPDNDVSSEDVQKSLAAIPEEIKKLSSTPKPITLEEAFPGDRYEPFRNAVAKHGYGEYKGMKTGVMLDDDGYIMGIAAKVLRDPGKSYDFVRDIEDFNTASSEDREEQIKVFRKIARAEGIINNAITKTAALVSSDGAFWVKRARRGKRRISNVLEELTMILEWWMHNVNSRGLDGAITGARGLSAIIDAGSRQSLIEGSWIGYQHWKTVEVPSVGRKVELPMFLQSMATEMIEVPDALVGTGLERFFWAPPRSMITNLTNTSDKFVKEAIDNSFDQEALNELKNNGRLELQADRVLHVKHRGLETAAFGESFIEPIVSDLAYKRALQQLDFVTIESLINRMVIIKVGSDNEKSQYHNIEFAQKRLVTLQRMFDTVDPSMTLLWAGPDIEVVDVGAHGSVADLDGRYETAHERLILAMGVPRALLTGSAEGAGQVWAGYEGYKETLRSMQNSWKQQIITLGERIADRNGFEGVELSFDFSRNVLADQTANAKLALQVRQAGMSSIRKTIVELGGDFESERRNKILEMGLDPDADDLPTDEEIFMPPAGMPGDTRSIDDDGNVRDPGRDSQEGRPPDDERQDLEPERDREQRREEREEDDE